MENKVIARIISYVRRAKDQETIVKYLRSLDFEFFNYAQLPLKIPDTYEKYSFMIRKFSINGKEYPDKRLVFAIKIVGKRVPYIITFENGRFLSKDRIPWKIPKRTNFKKVKTQTKFPKEMTYKQRRDWRYEHSKVITGKQVEPSKFYSKWKDKIQFLAV